MDSNRSRVKVYELNSDSQWTDKGTGQVSQQYVEAKEGCCLIVRSEEDASVLLNSKIRKDDVYHRQQETLIVWTEPNGTDLALSFQESEGCNEIWTGVVEIQKRLKAAIDGDIDQLPHPIAEPASDELRTTAPVVILEPSLGNLKEIEQIFVTASRTHFGREQLASAIIQENYLEKLLLMLETCEDLESMDELFSLSNIMRIIIFLNETNIYEIILEEDTFLKVVGLLEYDREFPNSKADHRAHITKHANFKQIIPIPSPIIVDKICKTYRLQFLKDVALARLLDDNTFSTINSLIFSNHVDIVTYFGGNHEFLNELFELLSREKEEVVVAGENGENGMGDEDVRVAAETVAEATTVVSAGEAKQKKKNEVVVFLHELCGIAKHLQSSTRALFYRSLAQHGLLSIFEYTLADTEVQIRLAAAAILSSILEHDAALLRSFCVAQMKQDLPTPRLLEFLVGRFSQEPDLGLRSQLAEIIRTLLDTSGLEASEGIIVAASACGNNGGSNDSEEFLNLFYDHFMAKLVEPVLTLESASVKAENDGMAVLSLGESLAATCNQICEHLCFAIKHHSYRSKYYILGSPITQKILLLLKAKESYVRLAALRVVRTCVGVKDEFYNRHIIKHDVFGPILVALKETGGRYNLVNSACLELVEFIRKENIKSLVSNLVEKYKAMFSEFTYTDTFSALILRYEQNTDPTPHTENENSSLEPSLKVRKRGDGWGKVDEDEEAYFNDSDDDDDSNRINTTTTPQHDVTMTFVSPTRSSPVTLPVNLSAAVVVSSSLLSGRPDSSKFVSSPLALVDYPDDDDDDNSSGDEVVKNVIDNAKDTVTHSTMAHNMPSSVKSIPSVISSLLSHSSREEEQGPSLITHSQSASSAQQLQQPSLQLPLLSVPSETPPGMVSAATNNIPTKPAVLIPLAAAVAATSAMAKARGKRSPIDWEEDLDKTFLKKAKAE